MHDGNGRVMVFVVRDNSNCRFGTRDDDWELLEIQWQMAAVATVMAEARNTKERQDCKENFKAIALIPC